MLQLLMLRKGSSGNDDSVEEDSDSDFGDKGSRNGVIGDMQSEPMLSLDQFLTSNSPTNCREMTTADICYLIILMRCIPYKEVLSFCLHATVETTQSPMVPTTTTMPNCPCLILSMLNPTMLNLVEAVGLLRGHVAVVRPA